MEKNYSQTLNKATTYFTNMIKEREKYIQKITKLDLPKRIEIQTLPVSNFKDNKKPEASEKIKKLETTERLENFKIEGFKLKNMNENKILQNSKSPNSSKIIDSLSISTTGSPNSTTLKISTSSSTERINEKCHEAFDRVKTYFKNREMSNIKTSPKTKIVSKVNESTSTKIYDKSQKVPANAENADVIETNTAEEHLTKKGKMNFQQNKITCFDALTPAKRYLRSKLGIDQKSINVKKESIRNTTRIKTYPSITTRDSKKTVDPKDQSRSASPQLIPSKSDKTTERLTPAKRYLRSKLGIYEKTPNAKKDNINPASNPLEIQEVTNTENKIGSQPEPSAKHTAKISPTKVRQPIPIRPVSRNKETYSKKISPIIETNTKEKPKIKNISKTMKEKGLSTKTDIVTNIQPFLRETNKLSIEFKKPIVLTSSMEKILSNALKSGLKKINRSELQGLQLKIKSSFQSHKNSSVLEPSKYSEKSDLTSMQSILESKISDFQNEMEKRQKHTFDKIQQLENTILFRKQQLQEITKSKNKALKNYEKHKNH